MTSISDTNVVNAPGGLVELSYVERTTSVSIAGSGAGTQTDVISTTIVADGSPILIEFFAEEAQTAGSTSGAIVTELWIDGVDINRLTTTYHSTATNAIIVTPHYGQRRLVLSAGTHTIAIKVWSVGSGGVLTAGTSNSAGNAGPMYLRVSKIIQASQLIVQTPNAPLVTSLPSNAIDGQEVRYLADNTNGIIWNLRYRAGSSSSYKWEFIGGHPLMAYDSTQYNTTSTTLTRPGSSQITIPLAGDYSFDGSCGFVVAGTGATQYAYSHLTIDGTVIESSKTYVMASAYANAGVGQDSAFTRVRRDAITAGSNIYMMYASGSSGPIVYIRYIRYSATPIRVSA